MKTHEITLSGYVECLAVVNANQDIDVAKLPERLSLDKLISRGFVDEDSLREIPFMEADTLTIDGEEADWENIDIQFDRNYLRDTIGIKEPFYAWFLEGSAGDEWIYEIEDEDFDPSQFTIKILSGEVLDLADYVCMWEVRYRGELIEPTYGLDAYVYDDARNTPQLADFEYEDDDEE